MPRSRRAVYQIPALGLFAALLGACGATSNQQQIVNLIKDYGAHPLHLCTQYADAFMIKSQFVTKANCIAAASGPNAADPRVKVDSVQVKGNTAVAIRTTGTNPGAGSQDTITLVKTAGVWKVDSVVPKRP